MREAGRFRGLEPGRGAVPSAGESDGAVIDLASSLGGSEVLEEEYRRWRLPGDGGPAVLMPAE